ncbi:shikimate dehydrogenase [Brachyspira hampsonii]|uniref:Shikimate dehydrogenase (NADP(+)) n=2 Tax=Brachyspira hampsonii TaxID=1287055 RepID=A0AAC9TW73_9SPIR|nr:shikimate dehydrogenase [Brachyspira hampsonii]ASJ22059.1 shikimate dehydrogenase [Brachyspira hampsonii]MBW5381095.1 shikimate dehydrogenase [Brachyspira hampsonii]OEJ16950.1 shikimate dehydrogenase [Brachyspira hampsonii]
MQVNAETILTGLFASPSKHSISPIMHNEGFNKLNLNYIYLAFEVDKNNLKDAVTSIRMLNMRGVNLSMPNKKEVIKYLDNISEAAELSQSVNTIVNNNGILTGYSTDGEGFIKSLEEEQVFIKNKNITILGTGGASIAIISQAALYGVKEIYVFKRDTNWNEQKKIIDNIAGKTNCSISLYSLEDKNILKSKIENSYVLINATSVGMKEDVSLIEDSSFFRNDLVVSDCIYHPAKTKLLKIAEKEGCKIINGMGMLLYQGALAFELWTNKKMPVEYIKNIIFK